ncbi:MAG: hypothetical protein ACTSQE_08780 [Candidatus Heimdallarchaeaceae archaeon]
MKAIIHLEEVLNFKADAKSKVIATDSSGILKVINPSGNTTLWGIKLSTEQESDVETQIEENIAHIEAGKEYATEYKTTLSPMLEISEIIDTNYNGEEINHLNRDLVYNVDQNLAFQITLTNNYDFSLKNINVEKHLPPDTKDVRAIDPYVGETTFLEEDNLLSWTIPEIKAGESTSIIIVCTIHPTNVQPYITGKIVLKCETDHKFSSLVPSIDADADNVDLRLKAEETTVPSQWNINFGLRNASEFEILLRNVTISVNGEEKYKEELNTELEIVPDELIWKKEIVAESDQYPEITKNFDYYVLYDITEHSVITYEKENDNLNVVKVNVSKQFEPSEVVTYAVKELIGTIDITNTGTATIGKIEIEDTIPPYVVFDQVVAESADKMLDVAFLEKQKGEPKPVKEDDREKATFEMIDEGGIEEKPEEPLTIPEPEPEDISKQRKYHYVIKELKLEPGQTVKVKTIGKANKPKFDGNQAAPATIKAYSEQPTIPYVTDALMENKTPLLVVEFRKRSYELTSIFKKIDENNYEIEIPVTNTGDVALDNVIITQPIFNAEYVSHTPPTVDVTVEGANVKCHIMQIKPSETTTIVLQVRADGPLRQQQATIRIED